MNSPISTSPMRDSVLSGSVASIASTFALLLCGKLELNDAWAPLNGPSKWLFGRHAAYVPRFSMRHTVSGYLIHHAMSVAWAVVFEQSRLHSAAHRTHAKVPLSEAFATSALACFVDYNLTPERLTPGFEKRLSRTSLAVVYGAFALGLVGGALLNAIQQR